MIKAGDWPTLSELENALRNAWSIETSDEPENWSMANCSRGQCGASTLVVNDWFGGDLLISTVHVEGKQIGVHYSNRLPNGSTFDPTGDQFFPYENVGSPEMVERIAILPKSGAERYKTLSARVGDILCRK